MAYGETNAAGSKYGFLLHRDGDPDATWTDETSSLTFFGSERADNKICAAADNNNNVYLFTQNANVSGSDPHNTLYKRSNAGVWSKFAVNTNGSGLIWRSPAMVVDVSNGKLFLIGINTSTQFAEYKSCLVGSEASLNGAATAVLLSSPGDTFQDVSAPAPSITSASSLMVCAQNATDDDIWFNILNLTPVTIGSVALSTDEVNTNASYTISLTLGNNGALAANFGTITFTFPDNTVVPNPIIAGNIAVDGTPATTVISNSATRQVTVTTPVNLADSQTFSVVFNAAAGLFNSSLVGPYQLNASTSVQTAPANSPIYNLTAATTTVTPATVSMTVSDPDSCSNYTIAFNLGAHGRMVAGTSTFSVTFDAATQITNGSLTGVKVNGVAATATGNAVVKTIDITLPAAVPLGNNAAVSLYLPASAVCNPSISNNYTLTVATSVEGTAVISNPYKIIDRLAIGTVTVSPTNANNNASYTIPLTLASNGALTANVDVISFRFPDGTNVPGVITANQITVNGTPATTATSNNLTREVNVTTPVNLANSQSFNVVFAAGAGLINPPFIGDFTLQAWTNIQPSAATSPVYHIDPSVGGAPISTTTRAGYRKSNQSKVFYHNFQWWAIAFENPENRWYFWRYDGTAWTKVLGIDKGLAYHYDVLVNSSANKLYLLGSHKSTTRFRRYSYTGSSWKMDSNFPVKMPDFPNVDTNNPVAMTMAKNGDLWIFRIDTNKLQAKRSSDGGNTWSAVVDVKTGLNTSNGTVDAVAFTQGGMNYVGVAYGETDSPSPQSRFGFLRHLDGDLDNVWVDESASLTFFGIERAINYVSMAVDASSNVYLLTRAVGGANGDPRNTLYKRNNTGVWDKYKVNTAPYPGWKAPTLAIDDSGGRLFVMGVHNVDLVAGYKSCLLGEEATLDTAASTASMSVMPTLA